MHTSVKALGLSFIFCIASNLVVSGNEPETQISFQPSQTDTIEGQAYLGWESRYFSEGRDDLDGDSLFISSFEFNWKNISAGVWYGNSPEQRYDELQLSLAISHSIGDFDFYGSYTHFRFPLENSNENELGVGAAWSGLPNEIELSIDAYYSFETDGFFAEVAASREFSITDKLALNFSVPIGINLGYVDDGHDGANNIAARVGWDYTLSESLTLTAHTTYSWALDRDNSLPGDEQLIDFFHGGIGLQWSF